MKCVKFTENLETSFGKERPNISSTSFVSLVSSTGKKGKLKNTLSIQKVVFSIKQKPF